MAVVTILAVTQACVPEPFSRREPPLLPDGVFMSVRERTYPVRGRTVAAIGRSLEHAGPRWEGRVVQGLTSWCVRWEWRSTMHEGACRLLNVRVLLEVEIVLPDWKDHDSASPSLAFAWERFEEALRGHEYGHRNIGMQAAVETFRVLEAVRTRDCTAIGDVAGTLARGIVRKYEKRNDVYERNTRRGRTQGAVWPPGG
jgi:predicted secreted Zn-dependent protease